jgi:hypothetical protein
MRSKSLLSVGRPLSSNLWSLIMAVFDDANVNPPSPASGHEYKKSMPWLHDETQFACEYCGDLVTLEKAKLRDDIRGPDKAFAQTLQQVSQSRAYP